LKLSENKGSSVDRLRLRKSLAEYLLTLKEGDPVFSVRDLAKRYNTSAGSISNTIHDLEALQAVTIARRGRIGSFLEQKSVRALWDIIVNGPMVIALTMPSFPKCEGLATALYSLLNSAGIETYLIFIRGSYNRLKALRDGRCHAAVMSSLAADELCGRKEAVVLELPPESFVTDHRVFYQSDEKRNHQPLRVAIDNDSYDLKFLTEQEFDDSKVEYHQVTLMQIGRHLLEGFVDAAIWNFDHMEPLLNDNISSRPMSPKVRALIGDRDTSAAVVIRSRSKSVKSVLGEILNPDEILEIQRKVIFGEMVPQY
jgi:hypothetical protein